MAARPRVRRDGAQPAVPAAGWLSTSSQGTPDGPCHGSLAAHLADHLSRHPTEGQFQAKAAAGVWAHWLQRIVCETILRELRGVSKGRSSSGVTKALNFGRFLVQEDRLAKLEFSESVLAPGGDSGQHDVGLALKALEEKSLESSEKDVLASLASFWEDSSMLDPLDPMTSGSYRDPSAGPMELSSCDGLCGRSWAAQQAYCRRPGSNQLAPGLIKQLSTGDHRSGMLLKASRKSQSLLIPALHF
eukprot:s2638_g10.t1